MTDLHQQALADSLIPVRPGEPGKRPSWNGQARQFIWAPAFDFKPVAGAASYRFGLSFEDGTSRQFRAGEPWASLAPVWKEVPVGTVELTVDGLNPQGEAIAQAGKRRFHRGAVFDGPYGHPRLPYDQSARLALDGLMREPFVQSWRATGRPDPGYPLYRYAAKVIGSLLGGCAMQARLAERAEDSAEAIAIGRGAGDFLIGISGPPGTALPFMPPTYHDAKTTERENDRWTMMMTPAEAGQGYLDLWDVTCDRKYLDAALRIADGYRALQLPSGTWHLKVDNHTGEPVAPNLLIPIEPIRFVARLVDSYRLAEYEPVLRRAVDWTMANPAKTFDWSAQFDDAKVRQPYENLSKHEACEFATYLLAHRRDPELAEEIVRFAEDQFVVWEQPPRLAPRQGNEALDPRHWITPCSCEQYAMFEPISGSSAFMINAFLAAYRATGKPLYLAKAQSLGNALTVAQQKHGGRYPTRMIDQDLAYWINSTINTARAILLLADAAGAG
jgi:maltose/maltodextrin transport system substrate-binding protein